MENLPEESVLFSGCFTHALDGKGRVQFPSSFRQALKLGGLDRVVLTNFICDGARCLEGYELAAWNKFRAKLSSRSRFDPKVRKLENFYLARAVECQVDGAGRISLPLNLRDYAGLKKEVVFTSSLHGFRVWDKRVWELIFQESESSLLEDPGLFLDVDL